MVRTRIEDELVDAVKEGDEARAQALVSQLGTPRKARALLEAMLADSDALARQAGAFGLGVLGGAASVKRLEQQLALEEARGDYDGESVVEAITQALGRVEQAGARASLVRRLERLAVSKQNLGDVSTLARQLWRRRHPELLPSVQRSVEQLPERASNALRGLLLLLEKSPEALQAWACDPSTPIEHKRSVLIMLEEELPAALVPALPSFISTASAVVETAERQRGEASQYCDRLLAVLIHHREQVLPALPETVLSELRSLARRLVASVALDCAVRAAVLLESVGLPEDAALLEAHRPAAPALAKVFEDAARALRDSRKP